MLILQTEAIMGRRISSGESSNAKKKKKKKQYCDVGCRSVEGQPR